MADLTNLVSGVTPVSSWLSLINANNAILANCFAGETAPANPADGQYWYKPSTKATYQYQTNAWVLDPTATVALEVTNARGSAANLDARLSVAINDDGTLKGTAPASDWWTVEGDTVAYVGATQFTVEGDKTALYLENRAVLLTQTSSGVAYVEEATAAGSPILTTVTVKGGVAVDSGLTAVSYGQPDGNQPYVTYMTNPMTTAGDMIVGGTGGSPERLAIGADNTVLKSDGTTQLYGTVDLEEMTTVLGNANKLIGYDATGVPSAVDAPSVDLTYTNIESVPANSVLTNNTTSTGGAVAVALSASNLLGRGSTGNIAPITLGTGLTMTGAVLSSSATATVADSSISTAKLKTAQGEASVTSPSSTGVEQTVTLPGGEYGFYPRFKFGVPSNPSSNFTSVGNNAFFVGVITRSINSGYFTAICLNTANTANATNATMYAQQRYVTASGTQHWVFLMCDKISGEIVGTYSSPDHPAYGNGGDFDSVPHPFINMDSEKYEVVLIDQSTITSIKENYENITDAVHSEFIVDFTEELEYEPVHSGKYITENNEQVIELVQNIPSYIKVRRLKKLTDEDKANRLVSNQQKDYDNYNDSISSRRLTRFEKETDHLLFKYQETGLESDRLVWVDAKDAIREELKYLEEMTLEEIQVLFPLLNL